MAEVIRMPLLSDTMTEGKIISWNKKVGDKVKADDVLADVETDKATVAFEATEPGILVRRTRPPVHPPPARLAL